MKTMMKILSVQCMMLFIPCSSCQSNSSLKQSSESDEASLVSNDNTSSKKESLVGVINLFMYLDGEYIEDKFIPINIGHEMGLGSKGSMSASVNWSYDECELEYNHDEIKISKIPMLDRFYRFVGLKAGDSQIKVRIRDYEKVFHFTISDVQTIETKWLFEKTDVDFSLPMGGIYCTTAEQAKKIVRDYALSYAKIPTNGSYYEKKCVFIYHHFKPYSEELAFQNAFIYNSTLYYNVSRVDGDLHKDPLAASIPQLYIIEIEKQYANLPFKIYKGFEPSIMID